MALHTNPKRERGRTSLTLRVGIECGSAPEPRDPRAAVVEFKAVSVGERVGELFLVRHEQDAVQMAAEVLQFLDHHLPAVAVEAAEALVNNHRFDRTVLAAGVLADAQGQTNGDAEPLAAAEERDVD